MAALGGGPKEGGSTLSSCSCGTSFPFEAEGFFSAPAIGATPKTRTREKRTDQCNNGVLAIAFSHSGKALALNQTDPVLFHYTGKSWLGFTTRLFPNLYIIEGTDAPKRDADNIHICRWSLKDGPHGLWSVAIDIPRCVA